MMKQISFIESNKKHHKKLVSLYKLLVYIGIILMIIGVACCFSFEWVYFSKACVSFGILFYGLSMLKLQNRAF